MKSIKAKLMLFMGTLIAILCIGLGLVSYISSSNALRSNSKNMLPILAEQSASNVQAAITGELSSLEVVAARNDIRDKNISWGQKLPVLLEEVKRSGVIKMGIADKEGNINYTDGKSANVKERDYFISALAGKPSISDPLISKVDGSIVVVFATPIKNNNEVVGVLISTRNGNELSAITDTIEIGKTGYAFMTKKNGTIIAHINKDMVIGMYNPIEESKKDATLKPFANILDKMGVGEKGIGEYNFDGADKYVGYAPVDGTEWSIAVVVSKSEVLAELNSLKVWVCISSILFILIGLIVAYIISLNLSNGIKWTSNHLKLLSNGVFCEEISPKYIKMKDEIGGMTRSMKLMQDSLRGMINSIKQNSTTINEQSESLSAVAEEICSSTQNVSEAINDIAEGTSSQSEDLINVKQIIDEFSNKISHMFTEIQIVDSNSRQISEMANSSSDEMEELSGSVIKVSSSFKAFNSKIMNLGKEINEISEITDLINSIAGQTNLLALNAAIEAARAGEAGRGFSVVADEIRKLAEQSKSSAQSISMLISEISKNTDIIVNDSIEMDNELINQVSIINSSIDSFSNIIEEVNEIIPKIGTVKKSAEDIDSDKNIILERLDGASSVALQVSASSEEIAASSQEMNAATEEVASSAQVLSNMTNEMLKEVNRFKV